MYRLSFYTEAYVIQNTVFKIWFYRSMHRGHKKTRRIESLGRKPTYGPKINNTENRYLLFLIEPLYRVVPCIAHCTVYNLWCVLQRTFALKINDQNDNKTKFTHDYQICLTENQIAYLRAYFDWDFSTKTTVNRL